MSAKLKPARPELSEQRAYMPRIPWAWIVGALVLVAGVTTAYRLREERKAEELKAQLVRVHEQQLQPASEQVLAFRKRISDLVLEAGQGEPKRFIDDRLNLAGLRKGQGLYLRIQASDTDSLEHIHKGAAEMTPDVIAACLGVTVTSARALFEKTTFLEPAWIDARRKEDSVMKLRVADEMLANHIRADLPAILGMLKSDWFLLVVQQGDNRRDFPVDVFLWDLRSGNGLLTSRIQARGALMPTRIFSHGVHKGPPVQAEQLRGAGAHDCSIASQIKALDGVKAPEIASTLPHQVTDAGVPTAAALETPSAKPE